MTKLIKMEKNEGVAKVTIDNPPMNVLSMQVTKELDETFQSLAEDNEVVAIILTGNGDKAFMAGADIKEFPDREKNIGVVNTHAVFNRIENINKPTIAVLNGFTLGGGLELALLCDIRIAEDHVKVGLPEINLGILPGGGGTQRLPRLIGNSFAKEVMFTGEPLSAEEALEKGIVNHVVKKGSGHQQATELAKKFTTKSLQSLSRIKQLVNVGSELSLSDGLKMEEELFDDIFTTDDAKEGVNAFIEKRKAAFKHK